MSGISIVLVVLGSLLWLVSILDCWLIISRASKLLSIVSNTSTSTLKDMSQVEARFTAFAQSKQFQPLMPMLLSHVHQSKGRMVLLKQPRVLFLAKAGTGVLPFPLRQAIWVLVFGLGAAMLAFSKQQMDLTHKQD